MKISERNEVSNFFSPNEKPKTPYSIKIRIIYSLALKALSIIAAFASLELAGGIFILSLLWDVSTMFYLHDFHNQEQELENRKIVEAVGLLKRSGLLLLGLATLRTIGELGNSVCV